MKTTSFWLRKRPEDSSDIHHQVAVRFLGEIFQDGRQWIDQIVGEIFATILFVFSEISQCFRQLEERHSTKDLVSSLSLLPVRDSRKDEEPVRLDLSIEEDVWESLWVIRRVVSRRSIEPIHCSLLSFSTSCRNKPTNRDVRSNPSEWLSRTEDLQRIGLLIEHREERCLPRRLLWEKKWSSSLFVLNSVVRRTTFRRLFTLLTWNWTEREGQRERERDESESLRPDWDERHGISPRSSPIRWRWRASWGFLRVSCCSSCRRDDVCAEHCKDRPISDRIHRIDSLRNRSTSSLGREEKGRIYFDKHWSMLRSTDWSRSSREVSRRKIRLCSWLKNRVDE